MISWKVLLSGELTSERTWSNSEFAKCRSEMGDFKGPFELLKGSLGMKWNKKNTIYCLLKRKMLNIFAYGQCSHQHSTISLSSQQHSGAEVCASVSLGR